MSHIITHNVNLDFNRFMDKIAVTAQHGEHGTRRILFQFFENGKPVSINAADPEYFYKIQLDKPDGTSIVRSTSDYPAPLSGFESKDPLSIYYILNKNDCSAIGIIHCKISIMHGSSELKTAVFKIRVEGGVKSEKDIISSSEYLRFEEFVKTVDSFDKRITTVEDYIANIADITNTEIDNLF